MTLSDLPRGEYFGKGRTKGLNELDALRFVAIELSRLEPDLNQVKWWDYRLLHHVEATRYWAHCYSVAARRFVRVAKDSARSQTAKTFEGKDVLQTREATACVLARQAMDRIGCRYPWAMNWLVDRFVDRGWNCFPRPNQLYGEETLMDLSDAWATEQRASLQRPEAALFSTPGRAGIRSEFKRWAVDQACARVSPPLRWMPLSSLSKEGFIDDAGDIEGLVSSGDLARVFPGSLHSHELRIYTALVR